MDPISAIGVAAAIIAFKDTATKIVDQLRELSGAGGVPSVFDDIHKRLPLILTIVRRTQHGTDSLDAEAQMALESTVRRCLEHVRQLDEMIRKASIQKGRSKLQKVVRAAASLAKAAQVQSITTALWNDVQLLTFLNAMPAKRVEPFGSRRESEASPPHARSTGVFLMPFTRDPQFVGRESVLSSIRDAFKRERRVAIAGIGGVGKSQVAIEYCYRFNEVNPDAHIFWVYCGNFARFYQGYKRIAQKLELPSCDDPDTPILELVSNWFAKTTTPFLIVLDNADDINDYWPAKYNSCSSSRDTSPNISSYFPENNANGYVLITTRDRRVADYLLKRREHITLDPMPGEEASKLFLSKIEVEPSEYSQEDKEKLLYKLDYFPLAISQAATFIRENNISISEYLVALKGDDAEEFLEEELSDSRRDEESINSVFQTWKLSFNQISRQKPRAVELLYLLAMLDRQSIPRFLLKTPEVVTSLGTLQAFSLITARAGSKSFQLHRLVQKFVQLTLKKSGTEQKWKDEALACVSKIYPTEIGVAERSDCEILAPHVQIVTKYEYRSTAAQLDLAHLLCWAADFDIERGMYAQALRRARQSLSIFERLVPEDDERLAAATWMCGRLQYYEARSESDINNAAETLRRALQISKNPSLNYAESTFELAHLYYCQRNELASLEMGKASFECWRAMEGPSSMRTLDNMHDYALELAMFGREEEAIANWQKILELCPASDASEDTKVVYFYRSMACIAEFRGEESKAEGFYANLISLCEVIYNPDHIHVFDYRLSHAEQIMLQGRLEEAARLIRAVLANCKNKSEWQINAGCLQIMAECCRKCGSFSQEEVYRLECLELHTRMLGKRYKQTIDAMEACARCFVNSAQFKRAESLYREIVTLREARLGSAHADTLSAREWGGICLVHQGRDAEAEIEFSEALSHQTEVDPRLFYNLCASLRNQQKWDVLESQCRRALNIEGDYRQSARQGLVVALEQQGKLEEALELRAESLAVNAASDDPTGSRQKPIYPLAQASTEPRFGRIIHPRTWSA